MRRKHLEKSYYDCDWTGLPIENNKIWCPLLKGEKQVKHGSFLNWECVSAYLHHIFTPTETDTKKVQGYKAKMLEDSLAKVHELAGYEPMPAPPFSIMKHFGGTVDIETFVTKSQERNDQLVGILISPTGEMTEVALQALGGTHRNSIKKVMGVENFDTIYIQKKLKNAAINKGRQVVMLTDLVSTDQPNATIGQFIKNIGVHLNGNVLLLIKRLNGEYYTNFTLQEFQENFAPQTQPGRGVKGRPRRDQGMSMEEFTEMKKMLDGKMGYVTEQTPIPGVDLLPANKRRKVVKQNSAHTAAE
jgi:hypothetical protein